VPTRQRAAALRLQHTRLKVKAGLKAWPSCDVIPWDAWLARCAAANQRAASAELRRLGAAEEWLLWREAAEQACAELDLLAPGSLADSLRRSVALVRDWGMRWPGEPTQESRVLLRAQRNFAERCRRLGACSVADWKQSLRHQVPAPLPLVMAGFAPPGPRLASRLQELGVEFWPPEQVSAHQAGHAIVAASDSTDELRRAARWCREQLQRDPGARLLVVDLMLERRRPLLLQSFEHELLAGGLLDGRAESPFRIEGGQALASHATVRAALGLLQLGTGGLDFAELAALLRSPYVGLGAQGQRAWLELQLRQRNVGRADCASLLALARGARSRGAAARDASAGEGRAAADDGLFSGLERMGALALTGRRERPAWWGPQFAALLEAGGWPGEQPLDSAELQQCERFRELLGEFSLITIGEEALGSGAALHWLDALAARTSFDAASGDVPVTVTGLTDDPLIDYDGVWVAGLSADCWPPPPRGDPFVPLAAQHAVNYPPASAHGRLTEARRAMAAWSRCARQLVCSWPASDAEVPLQPSGLLGTHQPRADARRDPVPVATDELVIAIRRSARRERRPDDRASAWPPGKALAGGTRVLQLQSECPFRAVAELRLGALALPEPMPGLDRRERGQMLHRALELTWRELGNSGALQRLAAQGSALEALACRVAGRAVGECLERRELPLAPALAVNEERRVGNLVAELLRQEVGRAESAGFRASRLEQTQDCELGGWALRVRMDRIDQLEDGRIVVLDYKSGAAQSFRPLDERPRQAQLLAYAVLAGERVAGVAAVHLAPGAIGWRGAAAEQALLPGLGRARAPSAPWPQLLEHWRAVVGRLVGDYVAGEAGVDPLPGACQSCHLATLCRVDADLQQEPDPESEATLAAGEAAHGD
jgi:ATP-dependent helicase/nuclease subunit B